MIAASALMGRVFWSSVVSFATSLPHRSYHGPAPILLIAETVVVLRKARHCLEAAQGVDDSAMR